MEEMREQAEMKKAVEARKMAKLAAQRDTPQARTSAELRTERDFEERAREEALLKERQRCELRINVIEEPNQNRQRDMEMLRKNFAEEKAKLEAQNEQIALCTKMAMSRRRVISLDGENNQLRGEVQSQSSSNLGGVDQREVDQTYGEVASSLSELRTESRERNEEVSQLRDLLRSTKENRH